LCVLGTLILCRLWFRCVLLGLCAELWGISTESNTCGVCLVVRSVCVSTVPGTGRG